LISHFREPMDVASSSFGESQTVFGGEANLHRALDNIAQQYQPKLVTVATTCLAETIGEDVSRLLRVYQEQHPGTMQTVSASTPSYKDGHIEGFHTMVHALVESLAKELGPKRSHINILPPIISPADLRYLRDLANAYGLSPTILPDYSDTLDGVILDQYHPLPEGGTTLAAIAEMPRSRVTLDLTLTGKAPRASTVLEQKGVPSTTLGLPIGVRACDAVCDLLSTFSGKKMPEWVAKERGHLLDGYADGHKYIFGKRVAVVGDPELVAGIAGFLSEIGARSVLCATGARNRALGPALLNLPAGMVEEVLEDTDYVQIENACKRLAPELIIGNSKVYRTARVLKIPLVRVGFPIHDRVGAGRVLTLGFRGTLRLFDEIINTLLEAKQSASAVGYSYL
jgi:nitrogenase molybdenum-iron protein NifN